MCGLSETATQTKKSALIVKEGKTDCHISKCERLLLISDGGKCFQSQNFGTNVFHENVNKMVLFADCFFHSCSLKGTVSDFSFKVSLDLFSASL